ncbi:MAG: pyruvate dehydrogenase complex E1 component subunit beta [Pseudomonadota bacterium]
MATEILMPRLSPAMEEGTLAKWLVAEGQSVSAGDVIAEIASGRATMEIEAHAEGRLARILVPAGTARVRVDTPIAVLVAKESGIAPSPHVGEGRGGVDGRPSAAGSDTGMPPVTSAGTPPTLGPFPRGGGEKTTTITMREALRDAIAEEMRRDPDVLLIGVDVTQGEGAHKVAEGLADEFGTGRVIDTPITEQGFVGIAVGAAFAGLKPVVELMNWSFAMQAIDHIINSAAKTLYMSGGALSCPIVLRGPNGATSQVGAQHAQCYAAWYAHVPGLKVVAPSNSADAKGLLKSAIRDANPVLVLESEALYETLCEVPVDDEWLVPIGKARIARQGRDVTIVAFGRAMVHALAAAERLAGDGIEAEVIDLRSLRPLDMETVLTSVARTNRIVIVEEAWPVCSVGSEIAARVAIEAFDHLDAPPAKVSGADVPMPYAANLERLALPGPEQVIEATLRVLYRNEDGRPR